MSIEQTYDDYEQLDDVLSTFYEALRLYRMLFILVRLASFTD